MTENIRGGWVTLEQAAVLTGISEDELLCQALHGSLIMRLWHGNVFCHRNSLERYLLMRETHPTGFAALRRP